MRLSPVSPSESRKYELMIGVGGNHSNSFMCELTLHIVQPWLLPPPSVRKLNSHIFVSRLAG